MSALRRPPSRVSGTLTLAVCAVVGLIVSQLCLALFFVVFENLGRLLFARLPPTLGLCIFVGLWVLLAVAIAAGLVHFIYVWRRDAYLLFRAQALAAGRCPACDYDLRGTAEPRCPECGEPFAAQEWPPGRPGNQP